MKRYSCAVLIAILSMPGTAVLVFTGNVSADELRVGVATIDITPPVGYRMSGYFYERPSTGIHDPLQAKALVLEQGDVRVAWVFCDLVGIAPNVSAAARALATQRTGIPRANLMIAATHTHTGPLYFGVLRDQFHAHAKNDQGSDPLERVDYPLVLTEKLATVIATAASQAAPAELSAGVATQEGLSFNRRFHMRSGPVKTNPGKLNPDILRPVGPIDPQVGLLLWRRGGKPLAGLTVFALHLDTISGTDYAADFPFYVENVLRAKLGDHYSSLFANGTCGDINHVDVTSDDPQKGHAEAERIGTTLGKTVAAAIDELPAIESPRLAAISKTIEVPLQQFTTVEIARAREQVPIIGTRKLPFLEEVTAYKIAAIANYQADTLPMEVQVFRLSDEVAVVGLPGEVFVDLGLAIKRGSPFKTTLVIELTNDYPGYIPTRRAFVEESYEVVNSRVASGGGEMLVETALALLGQVHEQRNR